MKMENGQSIFVGNIKGGVGKSTITALLYDYFRLRFPKNFIFVNDRLLVSQFKNQFKNMKKSPLLHINFYDNGKVIDVGGDTGGKATTKYNKPEAIIHRVANKFREKNGKFELYKFKVREQPYLLSWNLSSTDTSYPKSFKGIKPAGQFTKEMFSKEKGMMLKAAEDPNHPEFKKYMETNYQSTLKR